MLLLPLLLLGVILPGGDNEDVFQGPTSFHLKQISTFVNSTWAQNLGSGWLDDLQIHGWESDSGTAIFLKPWSKGNFSDEEITELVDLFRVYLIGFIREVQDRVNEFQLEYPFVIQVIEGCELHSGEAIESSLRGALGGLDVLRIQNHSCMPAPDSGNRGQKLCALLSQYQGTSDIIERLVSETCPRYLLGVLDAGKAELQRQVKPEAWLSSGPTPGPGRLLLVCHVSGFYPKPVQVIWMRGKQEQPGTQQGDIMPNADWTWYLRVTLNVAAGEAAGLSCRVKHSSLGDQDIILYWGHPTSIGLILVAIIVPSLILSICLALWFWRRCVPGANCLLSQPDFDLCQKHLGSNQGLGWLDDLQIHDWESDSYTAIFLKPRCKSNFSDEEMTELEDLFRIYFIGFTQEVQDHISEFSLEYPFGIQVIESCGLHSGKAIGSSLRGVLGGLDFVRIQNHSCVPAPDSGSRRQKFCALKTQYQSISNVIEKLMSETCPRYPGCPRCSKGRTAEASEA